MCYEQKNLLSDDYLIAQSLIDDIKYIESELPAYSRLYNEQTRGKIKDTDFGDITFRSCKSFVYWAYFSFETASPDIPIVIEFEKYNVVVNIKMSSTFNPYWKTTPRWVVFDHQTLYSLDYVKTILELCPILSYCMLRVREFVTNELEMK